MGECGPSDRTGDMTVGLDPQASKPHFSAGAFGEKVNGYASIMKLGGFEITGCHLPFVPETESRVQQRRQWGGGGR